MSRTFTGGNSTDSRAQSGRQRGEPMYSPPSAVPTPTVGGIHPALPILASASDSMTKAKLMDTINTAIEKMGG